MKNWQKVRRELGSTPLAEGLVGGSAAGSAGLYVEHYMLHDIERTVSGLARTGLVTQFGGARVREGESGAWRSTTPRKLTPFSRAVRIYCWVITSAIEALVIRAM